MRGIMIAGEAVIMFIIIRNIVDVTPPSVLKEVQRRKPLRRKLLMKRRKHGTEVNIDW